MSASMRADPECPMKSDLLPDTGEGLETAGLFRYASHLHGEVAERSKAAVLKTVEGL